MKKITVYFTAIVIMLTLCSCTREPTADVFEFCSRVNKECAQDFLYSQSYYSDGENEYCFFSNVGATECVVSLTTDDKSCVSGVRMSLVSDIAPISAQGAQTVFDRFVLLCSVLSNRDADSLTQLFGENSFTADSISFTENRIEIEDEKLVVFIWTNENIISLYCVSA